VAKDEDDLPGFSETFAWTLFFTDFSLPGGAERFLHDSVGFVSYCFAVSVDTTEEA
jgi:hypothetical protein